VIVIDDDDECLPAATPVVTKDEPLTAADLVQGAKSEPFVKSEPGATRTRRSAADQVVIVHDFELETLPEDKSFEARDRPQSASDEMIVVDDEMEMDDTQMEMVPKIKPSVTRDPLGATVEQCIVPKDDEMETPSKSSSSAELTDSEGKDITSVPDCLADGINLLIVGMHIGKEAEKKGLSGGFFLLLFSVARHFSPAATIMLPIQTSF
jgi:hypothetical protein